MSRIFGGVFVAVFVGALAYEILNRSNPELTQKIKDLFSRGVNKVLMPSERNA
jgi:hypothetical protein